MNITELKELSSVRYFYKGSREHKMESLSLRGMFAIVNKPYTNRNSYFIGFKNDVMDVQVIPVRFVKTDKEVMESLKNPERKYLNLNLNNLVYTRLPLNVSTALKKIATVFAKEYTAQYELERLKLRAKESHDRYIEVLEEESKVLREENLSLVRTPSNESVYRLIDLELDVRKKLKGNLYYIGETIVYSRDIFLRAVDLPKGFKMEQDASGIYRTVYKGRNMEKAIKTFILENEKNVIGALQTKALKPLVKALKTIEEVSTENFSIKEFISVVPAVQNDGSFNLNFEIHINVKELGGDVVKETAVLIAKIDKILK